MAFIFNWSLADSTFYTRAQDLLTAALNKSPKPPIIIDDIVVTELNLGSIPPELEILEIGDLAEDRFRGIFKMSYDGDAYLTLKTRVQANPLNTYFGTRNEFTSMKPLAADSGLTIPLQITLSNFRLSGFIILVFSRQKGLTVVFRNDPLESLKVSSTFDSIPFVRDYLQKAIEGQLRLLFMDELPAIIHRLSLRLWVPEFKMAMEREEKSQAQSPNVAQTVSTHLPPQDPFLNPPSDPVDSAGHVLTSSEIGALSLDSSVEMHSLFSQKNLLRLAALADSQRTLSLFTPSIAEVAFRACTGVNSGGISDFYHFFDQQGASQSASASPATTPSSLPIPIPGGVGLHGYNYNYAPSLARTASHNTDVASSYPGSSRPSFSSGAGGKMSGFLGGRHGSIHNHTHNHAQKKKKRRVVDLRRKTSTAASSPTATDRERESEKAVEATREKFDAVTLDTKRDYLLSDTATDAADSTAAVAGDDSTTPTISEEDEDEESDGIFVTPPTSPPRVDVETTPTQKTENARLQTTPTKNKPQHTQYLYPQAISPSPSPMSPPLPLASPYGEHQGHFFTAYPPQYTSAYPMPMPTPVPGATSVAAAAAAAAAAQNPGAQGMVGGGGGGGGGGGAGSNAAGILEQAFMMKMARKMQDGEEGDGAGFVAPPPYAQ